MKKTLLIDESGQASLASDEKGPFIITGVLIEKRDLSAIEGFFKYIKLKYRISTSSHFHSYDVYEDSSKKLTDGQLKNLSN